MLDGAELVLLIPALDAGPRVQAWGRAVRPVARHRGRAHRRPAPPRPTCATRSASALEDDGSLTDRASPRSASSASRSATGAAGSSPTSSACSPAEGDRLFADRFVTVRHGRYVLPVRAEARQRVRGIVHDRSQSGQTIFVEPEGAGRGEQRPRAGAARGGAGSGPDPGRADRRACGRGSPISSGSWPRIGELDWLFARAHAAERMDATAPVVDHTGRGGAARRPPSAAAGPGLARSRRGTVVPVDVELSPERPLLLITGPNAGGKTIALKTLALCALLAQVGGHVPAAEGSRLPVFERLFAIIGDEQSVAENLSTFSAFVKQIREVLAEADDRSLVLIDELGAGTDPDEGAALARAILEELADRGALVVATTHLEPLRAFASTEPRARNASVEFDTRTLAPTFRLRYDVPGQSYALAIAGRLGLVAGADRARPGPPLEPTPPA